MKKLVFICTAISVLCTIAHTLPPHAKRYQTDYFSMLTTPTWKEYPITNKMLRFDKEKWAWTSSFILKSKQPFKLTNLVLDWKGKKLDKVFASLYHKKERDSLIPIQKNLVCEGTWDAAKQQLMFSLNEKIIAVNKYHLVLSYPKRLEPSVKTGRFVVRNTTMKKMPS